LDYLEWRRGAVGIGAGADRGSLKMTASYWASERDGATNQATTRTEKLANAAAIISGLLRLSFGTASRFNVWKSMEEVGSNQ